MTNATQVVGQIKSPSRLLLVGATGVVGQAVLARALMDPAIREVVALTRRSIPIRDKLINIVVEFERLPNDANWWNVDAVICTLGTTMKVAGSPTQFAAIDRDLPVRIAEQARAHGATHFAINSSLGANPASSSFYLRTKGEMEQRIRGLGYPALTIVRPSLIDTHRSETRPGEEVAIFFSRLVRPLIPTRYRPVRPDVIAQALLAGATRADLGEQIVESDALAKNGGPVTATRQSTVR